jgi:plasmid stability protein
MADILIRGLEAEIVERLKSRAKRHGRSLQGEVKLIVEQAAGVRGPEIEAMLGRWQQRFAGRKFSSSTRLIREDRRR